MNPEYQRYLDSLIKEELIQERTLLKARILTSPTAPQNKEKKNPKSNPRSSLKRLGIFKGGPHTQPPGIY